MTVTGLHVDFDPLRWARLPHDPPDPDAWAMAESRTLWSLTATTPTDDQVATVGSYLLSALQISADMAADMAFAWFPDLAEPPGPIVALLVADPTDGSDEQLVGLLGLEEESVEPPTYDRIETPTGVALRYRRYGTTGSGGVALRVTFLWPLPDDDATLVLHASSPDLGKMSMVEPALDDLARAVSVRRD